MIELFAPAKVTLSLAVTGVREDGYHLLHSEMVTVDFGDDLRLAWGDALHLSPSWGISTGPENLIRRALDLTGRKADVSVTKRIPPGAGLGGGSADAGAILRWAGGVSDDVAATLGADVAFCQRGGRAMVTGIGDIVTPLAFVPQDLTLFLLDASVNTAECYRAYDDLVARGVVMSGKNHLEVAARMVEPKVGFLLDDLRRRYGSATLAGSGSTCFVNGHVGTPGKTQTPWGAVTTVWTKTIR
jgi:4-diphosphocytidyl-2-C-methyl-D-erythritol kinase